MHAGDGTWQTERRYPGDPSRMRVVGLEGYTNSWRLGPGPVRVGRRLFWADEVEVTVRWASPAIWQPSQPADPTFPAASDGGQA